MKSFIITLVCLFAFALAIPTTLMNHGAEEGLNDYDDRFEANNSTDVHENNSTDIDDLEPAAKENQTDIATADNNVVSATDNATGNTTDMVSDVVDEDDHYHGPGQNHTHEVETTDYQANNNETGAIEDDTTNGDNNTNYNDDYDMNRDNGVGGDVGGNDDEEMNKEDGLDGAKELEDTTDAYGDEYHGVSQGTNHDDGLGADSVDDYSNYDSGYDLSKSVDSGKDSKESDDDSKDHDDDSDYSKDESDDNSSYGDESSDNSSDDSSDDYSDDDSSSDSDSSDDDSKDSDDSSDDNDGSSSDESGEYSNENSEDMSDNRSGSSLESDEKDEKRKQYLGKGIVNFDGDIKKFLDSVGKGELYDQLNSAVSVTGFSTLLLLAVVAAML